MREKGKKKAMFRHTQRATRSLQGNIDTAASDPLVWDPGDPGWETARTHEKSAFRRHLKY
jgi:hypothetical protein